jgi:hypothetical protein
LATAISLTPSANATGAFTTGASSTVGVEYYASYGEFLGWLVPDTLRYHILILCFFHAAFFFVCMASLSFVFLICGIRTNFMFEVVFLTLTLGFSCLAASYWQLANDLPSASAKLQTVRPQNTPYPYKFLFFHYLVTNIVCFCNRHPAHFSS